MLITVTAMTLAMMSPAAPPQIQTVDWYCGPNCRAEQRHRAVARHEHYERRERYGYDQPRHYEHEYPHRDTYYRN